MWWLGLLTSLLSVPTAPSTATTTTAPAAAPTVIIVVGAEGTAEYGSQFTRWADRWRNAAQRGDAQFVLVGASSATAGSSDKQRLRKLLIERSADSPAPLWLVLIGHGTFDGREAKFNLRDDDVSAQELSDWLKDVRRPLAVIVCASASGPLISKLSGDNRIVITATRSGSEIQFSRFGDHLSTAISDLAADLDKDGQVSLLEAFIAASHATLEFYKQEARLATEHALLEDNGDKLGIPADWFQGTRAIRAAKDGVPLDGPKAHQWHLVPSAGDQALSPEARVRRDQLEVEIETLRAKKSSISQPEYYTQLEKLLIELSRLSQQKDSSPATSPATRPKSSAR